MHEQVNIRVGRTRKTNKIKNKKLITFDTTMVLDLQDPMAQLQPQSFQDKVSIDTIYFENISILRIF